MSLRKKIFLSFFLSAFIIAILAVFEFINFLQIRGEMRSLEVSDTIRSKSLQLRRHEKNFFLYPDAAADELRAIKEYLNQLDGITATLEMKYEGPVLNGLVRDYRARFGGILELMAGIRAEFGSVRSSFPSYHRVIPLMETNFVDRPGYIADFLVNVFSLPRSHALVVKLRKLDGEIAALRKIGEDIIVTSKYIDTKAREKAESGLYVSQVAMVAGFPAFLLIGIGTLIFISNDVLRRLKTLTKAVEKTGAKFTTGLFEPEPWEGHRDEVDALIEKFRRMDSQLVAWEEELVEKNRLLLDTKKLAAIGTMASGVAHELNNPLNNIFLSMQVLRKQLGGEDLPEELRETLDDVFGQTVRVKGIVADLLEFAREKGPVFEPVELTELISHAYEMTMKTLSARGVDFRVDSPGEIIISADRGMLDRVFVNLFTNAVAAMEDGGGELVVKIEPGDDAVRIWVSDTGKGMSEEDMEKAFDPFFTRKDTGTGLGLAIVRNIIGKHRGNISVESEVGVGTAFEISLPMTAQEG